MSEEQTPSVEEIKERLKVEIPVEEEAEAPPHKAQVDIAAELQNVGRQFAETLQTAWNSQERQRVERDVRVGLQSFVAEVDKFIREAKDSPTAERVREEASQVKTRVETTDIGRKTRVGIVSGLRWLSEELGKMADQFTPTEKSPTDVEAGDQTE